MSINSSESFLATTGKRTISSSCVLFVVCVPVFCPTSDPRLIEGVELANNLNEGELVKKAQEWGSKLWEILAKEGGEKGDRDCEATNNKKSGSRTCQTLKVGDWVV